MMYADERYKKDAKFKMLVDTLHQQIRLLEFTPTEIREAAMLAQVHYEMINPRPIKVSSDLERHFEMLKNMPTSEEFYK